MQLWHLTADAPRVPLRVSPGEPVALHIGTSPIQPGQAVWVAYRIEHPDGGGDAGEAAAAWQCNAGRNSYWRAELGPFARGDRVTYRIRARAPDGEMSGAATSFTVGPKLFLALLWHQHQPAYKDTLHPTQAGSYRQPWVRLHAIRDYYSMAALAAEHPGVHLTINLTPVLLWQLEDYLERGATDRALELTRTPAEALSDEERERLLATFFDAHWHNEIFPHSRYKELFTRRREARPFAPQDLRDLQMWFNLAWFGPEFRGGEVALPTGEVASVRRFVEQGRDFSTADVEAMLAEQMKVMRAVIPLHRQLQERGQVEVSTTPFAHPILPLLIDTDQAALDRPGATYPRRFAHPEDADAQVRLAVECYARHFGRPPRGMWPAEGAVSQSSIPIFARHGVRWIATDRGVLQRSGRWGYDADDPDVLCQPYRAEEGGQAVSVFFRDTALSDAIGFRYAGVDDSERAARELLDQLKARFARRLTGDGDRVLTVALDGENAWGFYREQARPFLHALYGLLERDPEIQTVTFSDYLDGDTIRAVAPHPLDAQQRVYDLFTGSWIAQGGSASGVDLDTWIGAAEKNRGWELLGAARDFVARAGASAETAPAAFEALYLAEGSDWFWWYGDDHDSGNDADFDDLFRTHLKHVYRGLGAEPPDELDRYIVPRAVVWTFARPTHRVQPGNRLTISTNCPGVLTWWVDRGEAQVEELAAAGGVMAGLRRYHLTLGPFPSGARQVRFRFACTDRACDGEDICCKPDQQVVQLGAAGGTPTLPAEADAGVAPPLSTGRTP